MYSVPSPALLAPGEAILGSASAPGLPGAPGGRGRGGWGGDHLVRAGQAEHALLDRDLDEVVHGAVPGVCVHSG